MDLFNVPTLDNFLRAEVATTSATESATHTTVASADTATHGGEEHVATGLISDLALILIVAGIATVIFKRLKQPVVLGYIVAGFLVGPHFGYFPTVLHEANIEFWAELGIIFLLFSLGLEFSFKKLMNVGGSATVTTLFSVTGMIVLGYLSGKLMGFSFVSSLFLGGMLSMSSTTIIMKALDDLNMRHRQFAPQVLAVLIVEDLIAVILMVLLSSIAINDSVSGSELMWSVLKLTFFLVLWYVVGVYLIPSFISRQRKFLSDELLLVFCIGLCFLMVITATYAGFSAALGAFLMGSILAGTSEAERIEKITAPVKDLFGAIFFISVGMMVNPHVLGEFWLPIVMLSLIVIVGKFVFGVVGMLIGGQPLHIALQSGLSLPQIGEFSFIIATLGMSLGVIDDNIYPIIVSVSVITTFFTPYFIKSSDPICSWAESHTPRWLNNMLSRYSQQTKRNESEIGSLWKEVARRNIWRTLLYSVLLVAVLWISTKWLFPFADRLVGDTWGACIATIATLIVMAPFLLALCYPSMKRWEREKLRHSVQSNAPFMAIRAVRMSIAFGFLVFFLLDTTSHSVSIVVGTALLIFVGIYFSKIVRRQTTRLESTFVDNLHERELRRSGKNNNLVSNMHLAYIPIGYTCPFVGERLADARIGSRFGVNVASIQRGEELIAVPTADMRIFPGDTIGVIGTDNQIQALITEVESKPQARTAATGEMEFTSVVLSATSPLAGKRVADLDLRGRYSAMLVSVEKADGTFEPPTPDTVLCAGDNIWIVGNKQLMKQFCLDT